MRIVSLLPSATEIAFGLGLADQLVGVSCDCDYPAGAKGKPVVSFSALATGPGSSPSDIDAEVRTSITSDVPIYRLDNALIQSLSPDLILAQDLCRVCAVPSGHVSAALETIGVEADVISLDPHSLEEVLEGVALVADATGVGDEGRKVVSELQARVNEVRSRTESLEPIPALALEWADPPFSGGHWIPGMMSAAGARDVLGVERAPSRTCSWSEIAEGEPEVIVFMPCGYGLQDAIAQTEDLRKDTGFGDTPAARNSAVFAVDGSSYFSRPGPRLVDGLEILAWIFHPELFPEPPAGRVERV